MENIEKDFDIEIVEEYNDIDISFDKIKEKCIQYNNKKIKKKEFIDFLNNNLIIEKYIDSNLKKQYILLFYAMNSEDNNDYIEMAYLFEICSILMFLFAYTNIDIKAEDIDEDTYDIVVESGLSDYILNKVGADFNNWIKLFERTVMFRNAYILNSFNEESMNIDELKKFSQETQSNFAKMDKDNLEYISNIMQSNDPSLQIIKDKIYDGIIQNNGTEKNNNKKE